MMKTSVLFRLAAVGVAVTAIAACTPRTPADTGAGNSVPPAGNDQYNPNAPGPVSGGNLGAAAPGSEQDFVVNVGDRVYFDLDSYSIRSEAYPRLDAQVAWLQRYPNVAVRIEGNADERGTAEYNLGLGDRRANAAKQYLNTINVGADKIELLSKGSLDAVKNADDGQAAKDRRVELVIIKNP